MTNEEMERAIEFLLKNQANFEARLEQTIERLDQTIEQVNQTSSQLGMVIETQNEFMQVVLQHITAQGEINASVRDSLRHLNGRVDNLEVQLGTVIETQNGFMQATLQHIAAQGEINASVRDSLHMLTSTVARLLNEGHNGKS
jgi:archaellum component FlaC